MPYSKVAPREYRKLHNLHASVQRDKSELSVRLPKQKPQFSYASGHEPDLPFLRKSEVANDDDIFDPGQSDEEFPSPSALAAYLKGDSDDPFESGNIAYEEATSTGQDDSLQSLEAGMLGLEEPVIRRLPTPKVNSSFVNGVFDFDAFDEKYGEPERFSSPLMRDSRKRERSQSPVLPEAKLRRVANQEPEASPLIRTSDNQESSATSEIPKVESRRVVKQQLAQQATQQRSVPAWVDEFDAELIESLIGIVDFVE
jgi:ATP-dependent DNA helicase HFM1/MER3